MKFNCLILCCFCAIAARSSPLEPSPCPNKLKTEDLDENIMKHMVETQGFRMSEIIRFVTGNVPSPATAMYHIVHRKFTKYMADLRVQGKIPAAESCIFESSKVSNTFQVGIRICLYSLFQH